jgi:CubicO group peptidase (beta-lactamase class C family)
MRVGGHPRCTGEGAIMNKTSKIVLGGLAGLAVIAVLIFVFRSRTSGGVESPPQPDYWPTLGWKTSTPEEQGLDSAKLADALLAMRDQKVNIHSLLVIRNGRVILDACFYPYNCASVHNMRSVTKSLTTTLVGMAIDQGKLHLADSMISFFPEIPISHPDPQLQTVTVKDLAMMANGLESMGFEQDEGTLQQMEYGDNFMQFAVDRKVAAKPGTKFVYDSPGMHILSGILQKATGMTELEYARQVLFGPLGIQDVVWPADAQGYTHGWGDVHLMPRDAAKIGYLWLYGGQWEGRQLISADWVKAASKTQIKTGQDDNYSYGWWISEDSGAVNAVGRGGQYIKVTPSFNAVVVATGAGWEFDQIDPFLLGSVVDLKNPLPPNPEGMAKLEAALQIIREAPMAQAVPPLPALAKSISGKIYAFDPNPAHLKTMTFDFNNSAEGSFVATFDNNQPPLAEIFGLDGVLHMFKGENGLPAGNRGHWADAGTFILERETIAGGEAFTYVAKFEGDRLTMTQSERDHSGGPTFTGTLQNP